MSTRNFQWRIEFKQSTESNPNPKSPSILIDRIVIVLIRVFMGKKEVMTTILQTQSQTPACGSWTSGSESRERRNKKIPTICLFAACWYNVVTVGVCICLAFAVMPESFFFWRLEIRKDSTSLMLWISSLWNINMVLFYGFSTRCLVFFILNNGVEPLWYYLLPCFLSYSWSVKMCLVSYFFLIYSNINSFPSDMVVLKDKIDEPDSA